MLIDKNKQPRFTRIMNTTKTTKILILGAGTAGTIMANRLAKQRRRDWDIQIIDEQATHYYQPGFLFLPFGRITESAITRQRAGFISKKVAYTQKPIDKIVADQNKVLLTDGSELPYDVLIVATGAQIAPEETPGLLGDLWHKQIFDFYTFEGAKALRDYLKDWQGGRLVVHITEMPIKCPVAPLEFSFLADDFFKQKKLRDKVDITFVTPLTGAFTKPVASAKLGHLLEERNITVVPEFSVEHIDNAQKKLVSYDGQEVPFDLLVTVPTNKGSAAVQRSGLGDELNFIPTDHHTLQSKAYQNIFVVGDATNVPASKAGSTAHFETEILAENIARFVDGQELKPAFDGHANCFVESGNGKALLIDFGYEVEPVEGTFPFAGIGPLQLLKESRLNHLGKKLFRLIYWYILLPARPLPFITAKLQLSGKKLTKK